MAFNSGIQWTHHTANLWWGCTAVHAGCDNCYAEKLAKRFGTEWGNDTPRRAIKNVFNDFRKMQEQAAKAGEVHRVFVGSMMDIFEKPMPVIDHTGAQLEGTTNDIRQRFFREIVPASPNLMFLLLTKRPSNILKYTPSYWVFNTPKNVMFGASVVDTKTAKDVHRHLSILRAQKFYSVEPQLAFIDFGADGLLDDIDWVIQGGESGADRRPFDTDWARHTRDVCASKGIPYFFKQVDKVLPIPTDLEVREFPKPNGRPWVI